MWILSAPNHRLPTASQQNAGFCGWISSLISCRMFRGFNLPHCRAKNQAKTNLPWLGIMVFQTLPESLQENVPPSWVWLVVGPWAASKMLLRKSLWNRTTWLIPCFVISENLLLILSFSLANQAFWKAKRFFVRECGQLFFFKNWCQTSLSWEVPFLSHFLEEHPNNSLLCQLPASLRVSHVVGQEDCHHCYQDCRPIFFAAQKTKSPAIFETMNQQKLGRKMIPA